MPIFHGTTIGDGVQLATPLTTPAEGSLFAFLSGRISAIPGSTYAPASHSHTWGQITSTPTTVGGYGIADAYTKTQVDGIAASKADLVGGLVPAGQLPSYVDDVLEFANAAAFPGTGEAGKIYVDLATAKIYRWSGSIYVELSASTAIWGQISGTLSNQTDLQAALNAKESPLTFSGPLSRTVNAISIPAATGSVNGYLSSTDWTTFNSKESPLTFSGPLSRTVNAISIPAASGSVNGYLSSTDWTTFNGKLPTPTGSSVSGANLTLGGTITLPGGNTITSASGAITFYSPVAGTPAYNFNGSQGAVNIVTDQGIMYLGNANMLRLDNRTGVKAVYPNADNTYDLGYSGGLAWKNIYAANLTVTSSVFVGAFTVGTLPSAASNNGATARVTDSNVAASGNYGATVAGGGSNKVRVFSNGTNWVIA